MSLSLAISPAPAILIERRSAPDGLTLYMEHPSPAPATVYETWDDGDGWASETDMGGSILMGHFPTQAGANRAFMALIKSYVELNNQALPA